MKNLDLRDSNVVENLKTVFRNQWPKKNLCQCTMVCLIFQVSRLISKLCQEWILSCFCEKKQQNFHRFQSEKNTNPFNGEKEKVTIS